MKKGFCSHSGPQQSLGAMSFAHYTNNPTDLNEQLFDNDKVTTTSLATLSAHSRTKSRCGCLAEQASITGHESNNLTSPQGDSETSSSTCSVTDYVATTILASDSTQLAPRNRLRQQDHKRRFSSGEGWNSRENRSITSTILQKQRSRCPSSARTPTRVTKGSITVGSRSPTLC